MTDSQLVWLVGLLVTVALLLPDGHAVRLARWSERRIRADDAAAHDGGPLDPALALDLLAAALGAGLPTGLALVLVGDQLRDGLGLALAAVGRTLCLGAALEEVQWVPEAEPTDRADPAGAAAGDGAAAASRAEVQQALDLVRAQLLVCERSGAQAGDVLRAAARQYRRTRRREREAQAGRLGVRLVLPLGLCSLPAFIALAVVPVVLSLLSGFLR